MWFVHYLSTHLWVVPFPRGLLGRQWGLWWGRYPHRPTLVHPITRWHHWLLHHGMHKWWALHTASRGPEVRKLWLMGRTNCPQRRWKYNLEIILINLWMHGTYTLISITISPLRCKNSVIILGFCTVFWITKRMLNVWKKNHPVDIMHSLLFRFCLFF